MMPLPVVDQGTTRCRSQAFTLRELLVVLVITGTLAGIAVPRLATSLVTQRLAMAARRLAADIDYARNRAKLTGLDVIMTFDVDDDWYALSNTPDPDHPGQPYRVNIDRDPHLTDVLSADCRGDSQLVFNMFGKPDSGAVIVVHVGNFARMIAVDSTTGRVSISETKLLDTASTEAQVVDVDVMRVYGAGKTLTITDGSEVEPIPCEPEFTDQPIIAEGGLSSL
ncbi:MAG: pilus assembly FimT family protein [Planctomycetota bacterium]|jgi:prepilin-type N-terminal cleavage/methylation domain-containing protein